MWLFQRVFALSLFCLALMVVCVFIKRTSLKIKTCLSSYNIALAVMAFFFVPADGNDLYRILIAMHSYDRVSFSELLSHHIMLSSTPGSVLYYWMIGKIGIDGLLPSITSLIVFGFLFSLLEMIGEDYELRRSEIALILFAFMARGLFFSAISGIRNMLSFAIISWCIYREFTNRSSIFKNIPLYLIACSFHATAIIFFAYRMIFQLFSRNDKGKKGYWKRFVAFAIIVISLVYGYRFINDALSLGEGYIQTKVDGVQYSYFWEGLLSFFSVGLAALCCYYSRRLLKIQTSPLPIELKRISLSIVTFVSLLVIFDLLSIYLNFSIFHRFSYMVSILNMVIMGMLLKSSADGNNRYSHLIGAVSIVILFISCARGNLCSLKFFI